MKNWILIVLIACFVLVAGAEAALDFNDPSFETCTSNGGSATFWTSDDYCNNSISHSGNWSQYRNMSTAMGMGPTQSNASWATIPAGTEYGFWYKGRDFGNCKINGTGRLSYWLGVTPTNRHYFDNSELIRDNTWHKWTNKTTVGITSTYQLSGTIYASAEDASCQGIELYLDDFFPSTYSIYHDEEIVNFTGYPLDGYSPLNVAFTVSNYSFVNATGTSWTFGDGQTGTSTISTINHSYQNPGIYTVSMSWYNSSGVQSTVTRNNYVLASTPSGMIVNLDVKNAITGALIQDSTVAIRNTTTGVWRNTTAPTGLVYFSTTDPGYLYPLSQNQSITLAANKTGYKAASTTFNIPYTNYRARLFLMPDNVGNATGTGNVVVNVIRNKDGLTVSGMSVVVDSGQIGVTNSAGAVTLFNVTAGARVVKVTDPDGAYQDTESSFTLVEGETKLLVVQVVLKGESPVTTYGTPVPTVTGTYDPDDPNSPGYGNYTATQVNQAGSEGIVQMLGQLIALWPLIVLGIFMKFMKSAFT